MYVRNARRLLAISLFAATAAGCGDALDSEFDAAFEGEGTESQEAALSGPGFKSITALKFDTDGTLYIGDSGTGLIHRMTPPAGTGFVERSYNLRNLDRRIADILGVNTTRLLRIRDLAVNPLSGEAYIAVSIAGSGGSPSTESTIVRVNQDGRILIVNTPIQASFSIPSDPSNDFVFYRSNTRWGPEFPSRDLSITDFEIHSGKLFITGMSNADFASTLWSLPKRFGKNARLSATSLEIYHAIHGQWETRAPIRSMVITEINGRNWLIGAYTCTPLVAVPVSSLVDGAHVTGKTIGELGYGNTPGDLLELEGSLFLNNKNQMAQQISMDAISAAVTQPGLVDPIFDYSKVDLGAFEVPVTSVIELDNQDAGRLLGLRRDPYRGDVELVSFMVGAAFFRISDHQSEYEFPDYTYPPGAEPIEAFQDWLKFEEGF